MRGGSSALADKPTGLSVDMPLKSDGSLASSTNAEMRNDGFNAGIAFNSGSAIGPSFATETDSDNSEDYSSKSSTAASFPKMSRKTSSWVGYQPDRNRVKNQTDITVVKDPFQWGNSQKEASKKVRGERIKIEEENYRSSMESDSRSSNVLFSHGSNSITGNGRRFNSKSTNYDEEILDEILDGSTIDDMQDILKEQQKRENEMEEEIASLFKQKIETEIQFIVVSRAIQTFDNELALDKEEMMHEGEVEKVETGEDEALKLENKAQRRGRVKRPAEEARETPRGGGDAPAPAVMRLRRKRRLQL